MTWTLRIVAVADYFASDLHLRLDKPDRSQRFSTFVDTLDGRDTLTIVGDLCDFWFASRQLECDPLQCTGLRSLVSFRERGGLLTILPGNHDAWLGRFYVEILDAQFSANPWRKTSYNLSVHAIHGHQLGARKPWKAAMESRVFLQGFSRLPGPVARTLADRLERSNSKALAETHRRHLTTYRNYATTLITVESMDLVLIGHVHDRFDESIGRGRMIVLGDWISGASYVRIDESGASFVVDQPLASTLHGAAHDLA